MRIRVIGVGALLVAVIAGLVPYVATADVGAATADPVIAAAGDIACSPLNADFNGGEGTPAACRQGATSDLILARSPSAVLPLGDLQYDSATASEFAGSYAPSWGRSKPVSHPVPGNHEYRTKGAAGYFGYFGSAAGSSSKSYYSYDVGSWHLIALNANCAYVACNSGSAQEKWLKADLAAHPGKCLLAYWHQPRFGTGQDTDDTYAAFWNDLYAAHADIILNGHDHQYERFAPQSPAGVADAGGIRQFIVGTGGEDHEGWDPGSPAAPNSQVRNMVDFGVLFLTLHSGGYDAAFQSVDSSFTDSASGTCHNTGSPLSVPGAPGGVVASGRDGSASVSWSAPSSGGAPASYVVTASPGGAAATVSAPSTSAVVSGLVNGTSYTFTVRASNAAGSGPASAPSNAVTPSSSSGSGAYASAVLADAPVAYWRLGERSGSVAADSSGQGRAGTISGGVTLGAAGALAGDANTAMAFDGSSGKVSVPDSSPLRLNGSFTVEFFAKMTSFANTWPGLIVKGASYTANGWLIWYQSDGTVWFKRNGVKWGTPAGAITSDRYHHFAVTYDGSTMRWFVDGAQVSAAAASFPSNVGTDPLMLGQGDNAGKESMDEVAVYPAALSPDRIQAHAAAAG